MSNRKCFKDTLITSLPFYHLSDKHSFLCLCLFLNFCTSNLLKLSYSWFLWPLEMWWLSRTEHRLSLEPFIQCALQQSEYGVHTRNRTPDHGIVGKIIYRVAQGDAFFTQLNRLAQWEHWSTTQRLLLVFVRTENGGFTAVGLIHERYILTEALQFVITKSNAQNWI